MDGQSSVPDIKEKKATSNAVVSKENQNTALLNIPVDKLTGVGISRSRLLEKLNISCVYDLITFFPRDYEDWSAICTIDELTHDEVCSFIAIVRTVPSLMRKGKLSILRATLADSSGVIRCTWFNQPYLKNKVKKGDEYFFRGKIRRDGSQFDVTNPFFDEAGQIEENAVRPVYPLTKGLTQGLLSTLIVKMLDSAIPYLEEPIPAEIRKKEKLCSVSYAYKKIHEPLSMDEMEIARTRLVYEELFLIQGGLRWMKMANKKDEKAPVIKLKKHQEKLLEKQITNLPFELTADQENIVKEALENMCKETPMNRLVQGDVGSGKTIIAAIAALACALSGHQAVFMAPTAILAEQHFHTLSAFFEGSGICVELLLGSTTTVQKRKIREHLKNGEIGVLIGTHAVLSKENHFLSLGLLITDEQHRFGVRQRGSFFEKGKKVPHVLVMSATPIPRTLGLILYGDLDVSILRSRPKGRIPVETYMASFNEEERVFEIVSRQIEKGRQVYFVCPLIEVQEEPQDGNQALKSVKELHQYLSEEIFPQYQVGLLHGDIKAAEKEKVMTAFMSGEMQIMVSTTVVEVGVDNPNASLMIIENAERFGLAQLHQLRGRIGRGAHRSVCILMSDKTEGISGERMRTLCRTIDGFEIAEKDMNLRGPGDFIGTRQHGIPDMKIANLYRDGDILAKVGKVWDEIFKKDPYLELPEHEMILPSLFRRFGEELLHPSL